MSLKQEERRKGEEKVRTEVIGAKICRCPNCNSETEMFAVVEKDNHGFFVAYYWKCKKCGKEFRW